MNFITGHLIILFNLLAIAPAFADKADFTFTELAGVKGQEEAPVSLDFLKNHQAIISFWRSDCAPCVKEAALWPKIAKEHPDMRIALISLQDAGHARRILDNAIPANLHILVAHDKDTDILTAFNDAAMRLPFTVINHPDGTLCDHYDGLIGFNKVNAWAAQC